MNMALKYAAKPVVAAPFSRALGGGCEIVLHCTRAQASAETYIGLVEVGVGVIPAGGGCKELLARLKDPLRIFELIGYAKVSTSAEDARKLGPAASRRFHLDESRAPDLRRQSAGAVAGSQLLARPRPQRIQVPGESAYAMMKLGAWSARQGNFITRLRRDHRRKARARFERRPALRRTDRLRAVFARSGARSVP